ncbi:MAG: gliding motility-associated C-terminal domain-containing protein, partial [Bacteroidota bacterium]
TPVADCIPMEELPGNFSGMSICGEPNNGTLNWSVSDSCFLYDPNYNFIGNDTACVIICDDLDVCDTSILIIHVYPNACGEFLEEDTVYVAIQDCDDLAEVCVDIPLDQYLEYNITLDGVNYLGQTAGCAYDSVMAYPLSAVPDLGTKGPYALEGWSLGGQTYQMEFDHISELADSMSIWDTAADWTYDVNEQIISGGSKYLVYGSLNIRQLASNAFAEVELNTNLKPLGTTFEVAEGAHELIFVHQATGCADTVLAIVSCIQPEVRMDTVMVTQSDTICLNISELPGAIDSVFNACEESSGEFVIFDLMDGSLCVEYTGMDIGVDSACMVVCDEFGLCDTTQLFVWVEDPSLGDTILPIAVVNNDTTIKNKEIVIDVISNDTINGTLTDIYIVEGPSNGTVILDVDAGALYTPDEDYCDPSGLDEFSYAICNEFGCDTTVVQIVVLCDDILIYTGLSPNDDGVNDVLFIQGIEKFPNNEILIFNRWGNEVFSQKGYNNDWAGTYKDKQLPDGTYFYIFDDGEGNKYSGYINILR